MPQAVTHSLEYNYPFELPCFYQCWWEHLAPKFNILHSQRELVIHRRKAIKQLQLNELRFAAWNAAWSQHLNKDRIDALKTFLQRKDWDYFSLIYKESSGSKALLSQLQSWGGELAQFEYSPEYIVDLNQGFEAYLAELSHSKRKEIRRKLRNADSLKAHMRRFSGEDGIQAFFSMFFEHHIAYWQQKAGDSYFSDPREQAFIIAWAKALEAEGLLLLEGFYLNDTLTNLTMNILMGNTLYSLITINTGAYQELAPGLLSLYYRMANAAEYDIQSVNMGYGEHGYKPSISNQQDPYRAVFFANPNSLKGQAYVKWLQFKDHGQALQPIAAGALSNIYLFPTTLMQSTAFNPAYHYIPSVLLAESAFSVEETFETLSLFYELSVNFLLVGF